MSDIFLSYTEKDRPAVRRLAEALQAEGWSVWWDRRIPAGRTWRDVLEEELESMRCMVVLWSSHSVQSDWVCEEAAEGRQRDRLVPVCIERVRPPVGFREIQAADLVGWDGSRDFPGLLQLVGDLRSRIGRARGAAPVEDLGADAARPRHETPQGAAGAAAGMMPAAEAPDRSAGGLAGAPAAAADRPHQSAAGPTPAPAAAAGPPPHAVAGTAAAQADAAQSRPVGVRADAAPHHRSRRHLAWAAVAASVLVAIVAFIVRGGESGSRSSAAGTVPAAETARARAEPGVGTSQRGAGVAPRAGGDASTLVRERLLPSVPSADRSSPVAAGATPAATSGVDSLDDPPATRRRSRPPTTVVPPDGRVPPLRSALRTDTSPARASPARCSRLRERLQIDAASPSDRAAYQRECG